jgi:septal ring factor EnvC (AmiA/AmiB activator)
MKSILKLTKIIAAKMSKSASEIRFENTRKKLANAFKNLEEIIKEKLHEAATNATMMNLSDQDSENIHSKFLEQEQLIQQLNKEINNLQKSLSELGKESEFLREKSYIMAAKFNDISVQKKTLLEAIEADLIRIEEVIKNHDH